ncbi:MAG: TrmH family RNA methyltransferase [Acidimicrobiales bacterium]
MKNLDPTGLKRLHRDWRRRTAQKITLILDSVQTPYNVGTILRTSAALGVEHLWLVGATESPTHTKTNKTAMGTQRYLEWTHVEEPEQAVAEARAAGYRVVGIELADNASPLHELDLRGDLCLVVGHEDRGLSKAALAACDDVGYIPQVGKVGSLNVGVAASIALAEARRQGWAGSST